jgi:hypothetical protein
MSSINGIVDRDRKNTDFAVLREMGRATVLRGPDQSGAYVNGNIGLYFNRFVGNEDEDARQPYTVTLGGKNYTVMIDGEIKGEPRSCAEAVMEYYLSFGYECFSRFDGDFALVILDEYRGETILARSRGSSRPLYFSLEKNKLIFSSEIKGMLRALGGAVRLNEKNLREHIFAPAGTYGAADLYVDIEEIPQGKCLVVSAFGTRLLPCISVSGDKEAEGELIIPDESDLFDIRRCLAEALIAFDIPQFDMFMPSVINTLRTESEKRKRAVRITDGARKYSERYIKEREDRLSGFFGVRFCTLPSDIDPTKKAGYTRLDSELESIVSSCDTRALENLYGKGIVERVRCERSMEARIRMTGMLCQSAFLAKTQSILLCSEEGTRDIYASRLSII